MYNLDQKSHSVKMQVIDDIINYFKTFVSKSFDIALIMPSTTFQSENKFINAGLINSSTKFIIFEKGINGLNFITYREIVDEYMKNILNLNRDEWYDNIRIFNKGIYYGDLNDIYLNIDNNRDKNHYLNFGFYDTCSMPLHVEWVSRHINVYKKGSPVIFTFDMDERNRNKHYVNENSIYSIYDKYDYFSKHKNYELNFFGINENDDLLNKASSICSYLNNNKLNVKKIYIYKEKEHNNHVMGTFVGIKK